MRRGYQQEVHGIQMISWHCRQCDEPLEAHDSLSLTYIDCPSCGTTSRIPRPKAETPRPDSVQAKAPKYPPAISFDCYNCKALLSVHAKYARKPVECAVCKEINIVPASQYSADIQSGRNTAGKGSQAKDGDSSELQTGCILAAGIAVIVAIIAGLRSLFGL